VDYVGVMKQAWRVTRESRVLRGLATISAAQLLVYSAVTGAMLVPLAVLPQLMRSFALASTSAATGAEPFGALGTRLLVNGGQALLSAVPLLASGLVFLFCLWIVLGIFDIAAQAGMIVEVDGVLQHRTAPLLDRLRNGFGMWWRVAGLSAVAAMPTLVMLLLVALVTMLTVTLPLSRGELPNPAAALSGQMVMVPLQGIASVATTVLAVVVQIALRSAVLEDLHWRQSLRRGFDLVRANLVHVALTYLIATALATAVALGFALLASVVAGVAGVALTALLAVSPAVLGPSLAVVAVLGGLVLAGVAVALYAHFIAWMAAVWTILWRGLVGPTDDAAGVTGVGAAASVGTE